MRREVTIAEVRTHQTQRGGVRWVVRDTDGHEYTTFREAIGARLKDLDGKRVRIEFHQERRGQYTNVYLDQVEPIGSGQANTLNGDTDPDEAAWQSAVAAAPWLVGEPKSAVQPKRLYDKLKPFEDYVAADIEKHQRDRSSGKDDRGQDD